MAGEILGMLGEINIDGRTQLIGLDNNMIK
jgi:hypothetical protein